MPQKLRILKSKPWPNCLLFYSGSATVIYHKWLKAEIIIFNKFEFQADDFPRILIHGWHP